MPSPPDSPVSNPSTAELYPLFDLSPCACVLLDAAGHIARANRVAADWLGWPAEQLATGHTLEEFLPPDGRSRWRRALAASLGSAVLAAFDVPLRGRQQAPRWVRLTASRIPAGHAHDSLLHVVLFDITAQRDAERKLQAVNDQQRAIIDSDRLCIARIRERRLVWASPGMARLFGQAREQLANLPTCRLFASEEACLRSGIDAFALHPDPARAGGELEMRRADGQALWVEARALSFDPVAAETLWLFTDISGRREAELALRASQSFLARTGAVAGVGGFEIEVASGAVRWSDETCRLHDAAPGTTLTLAAFLSCHAPEGRAVIEQAVSEAISFGASWDLELPMVATGGRRFWARTVGAAEHEGGRVVRLVGAVQDITERRHMQHALTSGRELLRVTLESIGDAVITTDNAGRVTWLNPVAERLTGRDRELVQGQPLVEVYRAIDEDTRSAAADPVACCLREGRAVESTGHRLLLAPGRREHAVEESVAPIRDGEGEVIGAVLVFRDVTEQRRMAREVAYRATHDALTDLSNRADFEARLARLLAACEQDDSSHAVMYIDLDQFKLLNDSCGHLVGDQVLRQIAAMFRFSLHGQDTVARLGGDEFGVILPDRDLDSARRRGEQICRALESYRFHFAGRRFRVGASIGLVPVDRRWRSVEALIEAADMTCYAAKEEGRNRVRVWREQDRSRVRSRVELSWATRLEQALQHHAFALQAQPVRSLPDGRAVLGWEVLLRMRDGDGQWLAPGGFLPPAERFHLLARIDRWVVGEVLRRLARDAGPWRDGERVGINLSAQSIADAALREELQARLAAAPQAAARLSFELSEQAVLSDLASARVLATALRATGAQVVVDDFGGTTAALDYLEGFPLDLLKLDRRLCATLPGSALEQVVLRSCLEVARVLGVPLVAKGLESAAHCEAAQALGFAWGQGFALELPAPLADQPGLADNRPSCLATA